jgi:Asp-tRNA(Asn)/Glu-tRNA(Gln) amidotransferase A subunit family amidase
LEGCANFSKHLWGWRYERAADSQLDMSISLEAADVVATAGAVRSGEVNAREAVEAAIARIEKLNPQFNFLAAERFEASLKEADQVDPTAPLETSGASREIAAFYELFDLWLSRTLHIPPFEIGFLRAGPGMSVDEVLRRDAVFTALTWTANMTGQPAPSYPAGETEEGVPIGVQPTGRYGGKDVLLSVAVQLDEMRKRT